MHEAASRAFPFFTETLQLFIAQFRTENRYALFLELLQRGGFGFDLQFPTRFISAIAPNGARTLPSVMK
ncbi:hypothetical protein CYK37_12735 [Mesorhizobium loti]|nr:hypothetical protein CYK37_12735 [Mesorhizobium loti]